MLHRVPSNKEKMLTVKVAPEVHNDFKTAADLKGGTMSALVHMFVVHTIREQKERNPEAFKKKKSEYERPVVTAKIKRSGKGKGRNHG